MLSLPLFAIVWETLNKRLHPTIASVTPCAGAQAAPATLAGEANVRMTGGAVHRNLVVLFFMVLASAAAGKTSVAEFDVQLYVDDSEIERCTMLTGLVEIKNVGSDSVSFDPPRFVDYKFWYILEFGESEYSVKEDSDPPLRIAGGRRVRLAPGEWVAIPFMLMGNGPEMVFESLGAYRVSVVVVLPGDGPRGVRRYVTPSVPVQVINSSYSASWRELTVGYGSGLLLFPWKTLDALSQFKGTRAYSYWLVYQYGGGRVEYVGDTSKNIGDVLDSTIVNEIRHFLCDKEAWAPCNRFWSYIEGPSQVAATGEYRNGCFLLSQY